MFGEAIAAGSGGVDAQVWTLVVGAIVVVALLIAVALAVRLVRSGNQRAARADAVHAERLRAHDEWRAHASRREFERHQRECPRCRGDLLGQGRFVTPPSTSTSPR